MAVRKLAQSWQYDFTIEGFKRQRTAGFRTRAEALLAERGGRERLLPGSRQVLFGEGYTQYMGATRMKDRARDSYEHLWKRIDPVLGHLYVEEVDTSAIDSFKQYGLSVAGRRLERISRIPVAIAIDARAGNPRPASGLAFGYFGHDRESSFREQFYQGRLSAVSALVALGVASHALLA